MKFFLASIFLVSWGSTFSQVGIGTITLSDAAILEVEGNPEVGEYRGLILSRVPNEIARDEINITASDVGLIVFVQDSGCLDIFNGDAWEHMICTGSSAPISPPQNETTTKAILIQNDSIKMKKDTSNKL